MTWWLNGGIPIIKDGKAVTNECNCCVPKVNCLYCDNGLPYRSYAIDLSAAVLTDSAFGRCQTCLDAVANVFVINQVTPEPAGSAFECWWHRESSCGSVSTCRVRWDMSFRTKTQLGDTSKLEILFLLNTTDVIDESFTWIYQFTKTATLDCSVADMTFTRTNSNPGFGPFGAWFGFPYEDMPLTISVTAVT